MTLKLYWNKPFRKVCIGIIQCFACRALIIPLTLFFPNIKGGFLFIAPAKGFNPAGPYPNHAGST